jgi:hypothetical protein
VLVCGAVRILDNHVLRYLFASFFSDKQLSTPGLFSLALLPNSDQISPATSEEMSRKLQRSLPSITPAACDVLPSVVFSRRLAVGGR